MLKYIITLLIINVVFIGCHQSVKSGIDNHSKITINLKDTLTKFSQIFDEVQYIPLETNINCNLGNIHKVQICKNIIYVCDQDANLYMFDISGRYLKTIGGQGRGTGERRGLSDFIIDKTNGGIEVLDNGLGRITKYDMNGNYVWAKKIPFHSSFFIKRDSSTYVFNNGNVMNGDMNNIYITDSELITMKTYSPVIAPSVSYSSLFPLANCDDEVLCSELFDNKVYVIGENNERRIKWEFDFGKYMVPKTYVNKFISESQNIDIIEVQTNNYNLFDQIAKEYALYIQNIEKSHHQFFFRFTILNDLEVYCLLNEHTNKLQLFTSEIIDDMNDLFLARLGYDFVDQSMVGVTYPFLLKKYRGNKYKSIEALKNVGESDNPIVVIYKLKNDEKLTN